MNKKGLIIPESVIDVSDVEHLFVSARAFMYYMNRLSGEDWEKEQLKDQNGLPPITLELIEKGVQGQDIKTMLENEKGKANYNAISDIELCHEIDKVILPRMGVKSVYCLSESEYDKVYKLVLEKFSPQKDQLERCLPKPKSTNRAKRKSKKSK